MSAASTALSRQKPHFKAAQKRRQPDHPLISDTQARTPKACSLP
jgi:hypothetical protein